MNRPMLRATALAAAAALSACAHHDQLSAFNYSHRPAGYHWTQKRAPVTHDVVWYGVDPSNGWTVYVGPDNVYYTYSHPGEITPDDLRSRWDPHDAAGASSSSP